MFLQGLPETGPGLAADRHLPRHFRIGTCRQVFERDLLARVHEIFQFLMLPYLVATRSLVYGCKTLAFKKLPALMWTVAASLF